MAGNARFHSKYHAKSHHTLPTPGYFDSASDPIGSPSEPFQGDFIMTGSLSAFCIIAKTSVVEVLSAGGYATSVKAVTGDYNISNTDSVVLLHGGEDGSTVMLPPASAVSNQEFTLKRTSETSDVSCLPQGTSMCDDIYSGIVLNEQFATIKIVSYENHWWTIFYSQPSMSPSIMLQSGGYLVMQDGVGYIILQDGTKIII